jgi:large subunit ribosomal protein L30
LPVTGGYRFREYLTADVKIIEMAKIRITQVKSRIGKPEDQKRTLDALGIRKLNHSVEHEATPQILGMVNKIKHLVKVENI